jgi:hypothetical protein
MSEWNLQIETPFSLRLLRRICQSLLASYQLNFCILACLVVFTNIQIQGCYWRRKLYKHESWVAKNGILIRNILVINNMSTVVLLFYFLVINCHESCFILTRYPALCKLFLTFQSLKCHLRRRRAMINPQNWLQSLSRKTCIWDQGCLDKNKRKIHDLNRRFNINLLNTQWALFTVSSEG